MDFNFKEVYKDRSFSIPSNMIKVNNGSITMPADFIKEFSKTPRPQIVEHRSPVSAREVIHVNVAYDKTNKAIRIVEGTLPDAYVAGVWSNSGLATLPMPRGLNRLGIERGWYKLVPDMEGVFKYEETANV